MESEYLDSKGLQELTGTKASTWRYWDISGTGPEGFPSSFKIGRRRVWKSRRCWHG
jgi:prophage regulatory protein